MWQAKTWPILREKFNQPRIVRQDVNWPRLNLCVDALMEVVNFKRHASC